MKTLLKSVHIYQSYCKKNLAQFFFGPPCIDLWFRETFEEVHVVGVLAARVFDGDDVVGGLVALDAWVCVAAEADEAVLAAQHQLGAVNDGHVESLAVGRDAVGDGVETAVHARRHVATVRRTQSHRAVRQPVDAE